MRRALVNVGNAVVFSDPKTASGRRSIALDAGTVTSLRAHRKAQNMGRIGIGPAYLDQDLGFAREDGAPLHPKQFLRSFLKLVGRSSLPTIRLHDLRHTYATLALKAGVHPKVGSERLGHHSILVTLDVYSHVLPSLQPEAAELVAGLILGPQSGA